jgi:hypothetical protein
MLRREALLKVQMKTTMQRSGFYIVVFCMVDFSLRRFQSEPGNR